MTLTKSITLPNPFSTDDYQVIEKIKEMLNPNEEVIIVISTVIKNFTRRLIYYAQYHIRLSAKKVGRPEII